MEMDSIYEDNLQLFKSEYREYGTGNVKAAGLPWSLDLPDGTNREGMSFQMGFVGQQIAVGYHLLRCGLQRGDEATRKKGGDHRGLLGLARHHGLLFPHGVVGSG